ncbi:hypothetical protein Slin15195_G060480 [Septoria linicola]|uniref:Lytic polysaccharide monooxygenase n=1 Tax=Septoria linicola TaxID=215465 RepID=A0A9Q9ANW3_9PEZI|nr:hypothetical protein Slin15195_G060480 [Septoria linicola]
MHPSQILARIVLCTATVSAHMQLFYPAPFNASNNPHRTTETADTYLEFPYNCCGENDRWMYPCRGYEKLLGTPDGAPTATWEAGSTANFSLWGPTELGGNHHGGSCQIGFSTDGGATFRVATSYEGNCPHRYNGVGPNGQNFGFKVPSDLEPGVQLFAWIWYNREKEFNMNCAAVNILSSSQSNSVGDTRTNYASGHAAFDTRPRMFVADNGNDCTTPHTSAELKYPEPGLEVVTGDGEYPLELPTGACGQAEMLAKQAYTG